MPDRSGVNIAWYKGYLYEVEIFVAKKSSNLSKLYAKINQLIRDPHSSISGYSLYEVEGEWRSKISIDENNKKDFNILKALKDKYEQGAFKDLIRPLITNGKDHYAIFDETSIVVKLIFQTKNVINWKNPNNVIIKQVKNLFSEITKDEKSILFSIKELCKVGSFCRHS